MDEPGKWKVLETRAGVDQVQNRDEVSKGQRRQGVYLGARESRYKR